MGEIGITEVGKYRIIEQVGEGAMGVVYRALDPVLNRTVAIKVMTDAVARDDDLRTRFLREAQAAGSLQHPNVITIYDFGEVDGHLFIAMEFVAGQDLEELLRKGVPLSVVQRIDILVDVLSGLNYAHKRGVVHRDIKPANIRIDDEGRGRIMDFGIAHLQSSKMTRTGLMVGTPAYMAPEQVTGGTIGPMTDIFSAGAVMYELFTGKRPFEGESLQSVFYKIVSQAPAELATYAPSLPPELNTIVMRALAKDPAHRFASALEMANALTEARSNLDRESSQSKRVSLRSAIDSGLSVRPTKPMPVQRSRLPFVVAGVAVAILAIAGAGILATLRQRSHNALKSVTQPPAMPSVAAVTPSATPTAPASLPPVAAPAPVQAAGRATSAKTAEPTASKTGKSTGPSAQELALFGSLRSSALDARRRASEAGATAEQLRAGDDHNTAASTAVQQGKVTEAATQLTLASNAWASAERDARAAAAAAASAAAKTRVAEPPKPEPVVVSPPVAAQAPAPTPVRPPPSNPAADIEAVVNAYERAIESRDLAEVRRAYVGITPSQANAWDTFFRSIRSIRVSLNVSNLDVKGDAAEAKLTGVYEYVTSSGKNQNQPANFQASFRHDSGVWKLTAVR